MRLSGALWFLVLSACASKPPPPPVEPAPEPEASVRRASLILAYMNGWGTGATFELLGSELTATLAMRQVVVRRVSAMEQPELRAAMQLLKATQTNAVCGEPGRHPSHWVFVGQGAIRSVVVVANSEVEACREVQQAANAIARLAGVTCNTRGCFRTAAEPETRSPAPE